MSRVVERRLSTRFDTFYFEDFTVANQNPSMMGATSSPLSQPPAFPIDDTKPSSDTTQSSILPEPTTMESKKATRSLLWKLDLHIIPILYLLFIALLIDRANIGNALIEGLPQELHMEGFDINIALMAHAIPYIVFQVPSSLLMRRMQPRYYLTAIAFGWGVATIGEGLTSSFAGLIVTRFLVGVFEAGLLPSVTYLISAYYKKYELQKRQSFMFTAFQIGGAFGGFLAYLFAKMNKLGGYASWRWIFIMEGILTCLICILTFFFVVPMPEESRFLSPENKLLLLSRLETEKVPSVHLTFKKIVLYVLHWKVICPMMIYLSATLSAGSIAAFGPSILRTIGYTSSQAQIHTIPVWMLALVCTMIAAFASDRLKLRSPFIIFGGIVCLTGWIIEFMAVDHINPKTGLGWGKQRYAGMFLIAIGEGIQYPTTVVWVANNFPERGRRLVGLAGMLGGAQLGALVASNVFLAAQQKRGYPTGFTVGLCVCAVGIVSSMLLVAGLWWENRKWDRDDRAREGEGGEMVVKGFRNTL